MNEWIKQRSDKYREFFEINSKTELLSAESNRFELPPEAEILKQFNIEWHFVPTAEALPFDESYRRRMYPTGFRQLKNSRHQNAVLQRLIEGHHKQQGFVVGVETTQKPIYLPRNRQFYGTRNGHDYAADPLAGYFGQASMTTGTRFDSSYPLLRGLFDLLNKDWNERGILPKGYRVTICPPAVFNLIGTIFHPEWSESESLELGFYRDKRGNATCFCVGANAPKDFSFIDVIEGEEWSLTGFRLALLPNATRYNA